VEERILSLPLISRCIALSATVLAACSALPNDRARETGLTPFSTSRTLAVREAVPARARDQDRSRSWMRPGATSIKRLLYVSDWQTNDVFVYDYATGDRVGKLTGFHAPYGQCEDAKGDIWIANYNGKTVVEYAHGGTTPLATLEAGKQNQGCAIDPVTGNLAVASLADKQHAILIWKRARGMPTAYSSESCFYVWVPAYDRSGNLYVESQQTDSTIDICALPRGSTTLAPVSSDLPIVYPANVMWDGEYLAFGDQEYDNTLYSGLYQAQEQASGGVRLAGSTELRDMVCGYSGVVAPFIVGTKNTPRNHRQGRVVIGENFFCRNRLDFWAYPAGGPLTGTLQKAPYIASAESVSSIR
jgi:hypothetical protein